MYWQCQVLQHTGLNLGSPPPVDHHAFHFSESLISYRPTPLCSANCKHTDDFPPAALRH
ncbi:Uncharacterised protein [Vibrio cholerae]|nr:Uncharacterised protein [Vibrio cholerae]